MAKVKFTILLIAMLFLVACGQKQEASHIQNTRSAPPSAPPIVGLSNFKIGMTVEEFLNIPEIKRIDVQDRSSQTTQERIDSAIGNGIGKVWKSNSQSKDYGYGKIYTSDITDFEFVTALGLSINGRDSYKIVTRFFEDKLTQITVVMIGKEFEDVLISKYGAPKIINNTRTVVCQNGYGAKSESPYGTEESVWGEGTAVTATFRRVFFDCNSLVMSYSIEDVKILARVKALEEKAQLDEKNSDLKYKASSSKI